MNENLRPIKLVSIRWTDAFSYEEAHPIDDDFDIHTVLTSGFLVKEDEEKLVICRDFFPNEKAGTLPLIRGTISIPRKMVITQRIFELGE